MEKAEKTFSEPKTAKEWVSLVKIIKKLSPEDYPKVDPAKFAEFKDDVLGSTSMKAYWPWMIIGILPAAFLQITQALGYVRWGGFIFLAAAGWVIFGMFQGGNKQKTAQEQARWRAKTVGKEIGLFNES